MNYQSTITNYPSINVKDAFTDDAMQSRTHGLDALHVESLCQSDPIDWKPIRVREFNGNRYLLIDGFLRVEAARKTNLATLNADVGPFPEGTTDAFRLNSGHGKALTLENRKAHARRLKTNVPGRSYLSIARECGLSEHTVKAEIEGLVVRAVATGNASASHPGEPSARGTDPLEEAINALWETGTRGIGPLNSRVTDVMIVLDETEGSEQPQLAKLLSQWGKSFIEAGQRFIK